MFLINIVLSPKITRTRIIFRKFVTGPIERRIIIVTERERVCVRTDNVMYSVCTMTNVTYEWPMSGDDQEPLKLLKV
jgi:hypothetical protein